MKSSVKKKFCYNLQNIHKTKKTLKNLTNITIERFSRVLATCDLEMDIRIANNCISLRFDRLAHSALLIS